MEQVIEIIHHSRLKNKNNQFTRNEWHWKQLRKTTKLTEQQIVNKISFTPPLPLQIDSFVSTATECIDL